MISSDHRHEHSSARGTLGALQMFTEHPPSLVGLVTTRVICMLHRTHHITNHLAALIGPPFCITSLLGTLSFRIIASSRRTFDSLHTIFIVHHVSTRHTQLAHYRIIEAHV